MTIAHVNTYAPKLQTPMRPECVATLRSATYTRQQLVDFLATRRPPLSEDQLKAVLAEFDKP